MKLKNFLNYVVIWNTHAFFILERNNLFLFPYRRKCQISPNFFAKKVSAIWASPCNCLHNFHENGKPFYSCETFEENPCKWHYNGIYTTVDCTLKELNSIPCGLPINATRIKLGYNRIEQVRMGELDNFPLLATLELDNNPILSISKFSFRELSNLTQITIKQTHVPVIQDSVKINYNYCISITGPPRTLPLFLAKIFILFGF